MTPQRRAGRGGRREAACRSAANAVCLGGPCHGLLTRVDQDLGLVRVPVPNDTGPDDTGPRGTVTAEYLVTRERVHQPGQSGPLLALHWAGVPVRVCRGGGP
ncbi:hypothetical protein [Spongiactinospora sp. TRM90649]|uniref:hypothetical protein n=1 Tax=Spongiactinospora sp. TRM90649 TaxID=3031114 RepID=UPI0023F77E16|nr:hypothetical protein [Spongiactinospora sp. TRM90649]MDF5752254.1 hypothetical protein [Spongiactinospora sp. TRM90649]